MGLMYTLKAEQTEFVDRLDMGYEKRKETRIICEFEAGTLGEDSEIN